PLPFVRWTEKRNFETILQAIAQKQIDVHRLITERVALADYERIYGNMSGSGSIASILEYDNKTAPPAHTIILKEKLFNESRGVLGIVGAGNFTSATLMPAMKKIGANVKYIVSSGGLSGTT